MSFPFGLNISPYTLITIVAVIVSFIVLYRLSYRYSVEYSPLHWFWFFILLCFGISGRILGYFLYDYPNTFTLQGETTVLGGIIGIMIVKISTLRIKKWYVNMSYVVPSILCLHIIGKMACLAGGCCYGTESDLPWTISSSHTLRTNKSTMLHPTQMYESMIFLFPFLLIFRYPNIVLQLINRRLLFPLYGIYYSIERIFIENIRGDAQTLHVFSIQCTLSQCVALFILLVSLFLLCFEYYQSRTKPY
jgi:phosphatidylglycerol:prolipoprotein diacylglycerol transferase